MSKSNCVLIEMYAKNKLLTNQENSHVDSGWHFYLIDYHSSNISHCTEDETVAVSFPSSLPMGRGLLYLNFTGELNDKLKGFYRCKYTGEDGSEKFCAVTHFEVNSTYNNIL